MHARVYRFGEFELRTATRELLKADGSSAILPTRVFDCVLHLVEQRARAVGRDELIAVIWNRLDVGDNMLAQLLARTRRFFDDTGDGQRVIRTLPGYGYQWIAETQVATDPGERPLRESIMPAGVPAPSRESHDQTRTKRS